MATNNDIRYCLDQALANIPGMPINVSENANSYPQTPTLHTTTKLFPLQRRAMTMGDDPYQQKVGFYRIYIKALLNEGTGDQLSIADRIERFFKPGKYLSSLRSGPSLSLDFENQSFLYDTKEVFVVVDYSEAASAYEESPYYCNSVDVGWRCINL